VKAALLRVADKYSGEEIVDLIHNKKFAKEFEKALEETKKKPENAEERKEKRKYSQDAEKLRVPVLKEEIELFKARRELQNQQRGAARAM
jgi:thiamine biosynthesis lipoprotein ApbE